MSFISGLVGICSFLLRYGERNEDTLKEQILVGGWAEDEDDEDLNENFKVSCVFLAYLLMAGKNNVLEENRAWVLMELVMWIMSVVTNVTMGLTRIPGMARSNKTRVCSKVVSKGSGRSQ